jgi:hypothetical protein
MKPGWSDTCRGWKSRVKGRDFYDFVWYVGRNIRPNLEHLEARRRQSGHWDGGAITPQVLVDLLRERFATIDIKQAADEVRVFLPDPRELQLWSHEFFDGLAGRTEGLVVRGQGLEWNLQLFASP